MKLLYEASNSVEAYMILNLLEQAGLTARIDGEYLQGGIGELQATGVVRVMIEENDYAEAKSIIDEWDANQPDKEENQLSVKKSSSFNSGIIGFLCGVAAMAIYYNTPVTDDGIDYNGDGNLDEKWTYVNYIISKSEIDRNFDGDVDLIYSFDRKGIIESSLSDKDFNGTFETEAHYNYGNIIWQKSDTTGDGFKDYRVKFKYGLLSQISFIEADTNRVIKIQEFGPHILKRAHIDTTGDGNLDALHEYDSIEEIATRSNKSSQGIP